MLHKFQDASEFDEKRQLLELELVTGTVPAATSLARNSRWMPFG